MKKRYIAFVISVLSLPLGVSNANAHDSVGLSINLGGPAYFGQPPVYVAPSPVYYAPPPVVYYRPAPVYYGPSAFFRYDDQSRFHGHEDHGEHRGWRKHERDHD